LQALVNNYCCLEIYSIIFGTIIICLIIALIVIVIKYPLDIIRGFLSFIRPDSYRTWFFAPIWFLFYGLDKLFNLNIIEKEESNDDLSEEAYKSTKNLEFDFSEGEKLISYSNADIQTLLDEFIAFSEGSYQLGDFDIKSKKAVLECPATISFYDYCILVQHIWNAQKSATFGMFLSAKLKFYFYQDDKTLHNLIGQTMDGKRFSIYTLDDLNKKIHLRLNNNIRVKKLDLLN